MNDRTSYKALSSRLSFQGSRLRRAGMPSDRREASSKYLHITASMLHFVLLLGRVSSVIGVSTVRGVPPDQLALYQGKDTFRCLQDLAHIDISRVNDDVCDCKDGSDEPGTLHTKLLDTCTHPATDVSSQWHTQSSPLVQPSLAGTSACANGSFYCANKGFKPKQIASCFVDDGVCDCCDGTDETDGCNDTCMALGAQLHQELLIKLERFQDGARARTTLVKQAIKKRDTWTSQTAELGPLVYSLKVEVNALRGISSVLWIVYTATSIVSQ
jgi:protein kinase C substrate 80K-H